MRVSCTCGQLTDFFVGIQCSELNVFNMLCINICCYWENFLNYTNPKLEYRTPSVFCLCCVKISFECRSNCHRKYGMLFCVVHIGYVIARAVVFDWFATSAVHLEVPLKPS